MKPLMGDRKYPIIGQGSRPKGAKAFVDYLINQK